MPRVCSMDMHSPRSGSLKAQKSTTCEPWVLITRTTWPAFIRAALPLRAGIRWRSCIRAWPLAKKPGTGQALLRGFSL